MRAKKRDVQYLLRAPAAPFGAKQRAEMSEILRTTCETASDISMSFTGCCALALTDNVTALKLARL